MSKICSCVAELIGNTPLVEVQHLQNTLGLKARLLVKPEFLNPGGSVKDRVALNMILESESQGLLHPGGTIIEPTSGNTGIGLACVAAAKGYRTVIVMPDSMSKERQMLMTAYGAQLVLTPGAMGMTGAIEKAKELQAQTPGSIIAGQFDNPANLNAHYKTTGPEIWTATQGQIDLFVAGVGTGGTLTGTGRFLKEKNPEIRLVGVEPAASPLLSGGKAGPHGLQGIGANFIPEVLDRELIDTVMTVTEEDAYAAARLLARTEGLLVGISSGAALHAGLELAKKNPGKTLVVLLPDTGERYLSTDLFA